MIITISGRPGSGKSSVAKIIAKELGYRYYSIGDLMGRIARKRKLSLLELSRIAERSRQIDEELDAAQVRLRGRDRIVLDSRLGFHFLPESLKIFLDVKIETGAKRISGVRRSDEKDNTSYAKTLANTKRRILSERKRYMRYYGIDPSDENNYDLVVDTSTISIQQAADRIMGFLKQKL